MVLLRGVNVGGNKTFKPASLAKEIAAGEGWAVANLGAAGSFVVRGGRDATAVQKAFAARLAFACEVIVVAGDAVLDLVDHFPAPTDTAAERHVVLAMASKPKAVTLPLTDPPGDAWRVRFDAIRGPFLLCTWRRDGNTIPDPSKLAAKHLGVACTGRNWNTVAKLAALVRGG